MKCGESDERNEEFRKNYSPERFFQLLISTPAPFIIDIGAHAGESVLMFRSIFPAATMVSIEPDPDSFTLLRDMIPEGSTALNLAVGSRTGSATFFQYGNLT